MFSAIVSAIVVGAIIGVLGRLAVRGKQHISMVATVLIGIIAALIGTFAANAMGVGDTNGVDWIKLVIQVVLAAIGVSIYAGRSNATSVSR